MSDTQTSTIHSRVQRTAHKLWKMGTKPSSISILDQAVVSATSLVTGVLLGRLCEAEGYGSYVLAMTVAIVGTGIMCELVTNPFTIYGQRRRGRALATYTGSAILHHVVVSVGVVLAILAVITACGQIDKLWQLLPVVLIAAPLVITREFVRQMSFARFHFATALVVDITISGLQFVGLAALWFTNTLTAGTALASLGIACGAATVIWLTHVWSDLRLSRRHAVLHAIRNWQFARWTLVAYLIGSTTPFIMPWILAGFHDEEATGRLAAANALIGLSYMFVSGVSNWLTAKAARAYRSDGVDGLLVVLGKTIVALMSVLLPFVVFVWFFGDALVALVFGPDFTGLGLVSFVIALGIVINTLNVVAGNGLWALDRPRDGLPADAMTFVSTALFAVMLVPPMGVLGAAISTSAAQAVGGIVRAAMLRKVLAEQTPKLAMPHAALGAVR